VVFSVTVLFHSQGLFTRLGCPALSTLLRWTLEMTSLKTANAIATTHRNLKSKTAQVVSYMASSVNVFIYLLTAQKNLKKSRKTIVIVLFSVETWKTKAR